jgi:phosphomethylpyrimidine synthase
VTPAEHLALPTPEEVYEGVISSRIAAHVGDMIKLKKRDADLEMGHARRDLDWERQFAVAINPERARAIRVRADAGRHRRLHDCAGTTVR